MDKLLFPVKLGPQVLVMLGGVGACGLLSSCGYQSIHSSRSELRLSVVAGPQAVPDPIAVQGALSGARSELGRSGALQAGGGYPRIIVEVLRVDEQALGIARATDGVTERPLARGTSIGVVGRARLVEAPSAPAARDSGDMRRVARFSASVDRHAETATREQALRSAARRLGRALVRRILGDPEPQNEAL